MLKQVTTTVKHRVLLPVVFLNKKPFNASSAGGNSGACISSYREFFLSISKGFSFFAIKNAKPRAFLSFLMIFIMTILSNKIFAQTNPIPFDMSTGSYSFTNWPSTSTAGTYPGNMSIWQHATLDPTLATTYTGDWTAAYSFSSKSRCSGQGTSGISFVNTSSTNTGGGNVGASVVAIKTTNRTNIQVSWLGRIISGGGTFNSSTQDRATSIRLQYRVGTASAFTDVSGPVEYSSLASASTYRATGSTQTFGPTTLPTACENQSVVQLRWVYYLSSGTQGARPEMAVDDISIQSTAATPAITPPTTALTAFTTTYGTASPAQTVAITGSNLTGTITTSTAPTGYELSSNGTTYGSTATLPSTGGTLYIRLSNTAAAGGSYNAQTITLTSGTATATVTTAATGNAVSKANQTIAFTPTLTNKVINDPAVTLTATATSGLAVTYASSDASVAALTGNSLSFPGVGTATITASQSGDANYNAATGVTQTQNVSAAAAQNQTISFTLSSPVTYGVTPITLTATSTSGLAVTYVSSDPTIASISGSVLTVNKAGSVTITASQAGNVSYNAAPDVTQALVINPKNLTVTGATASSKIYDGTNAATVTGAALSGIVGTDNVALSAAAATFSSANVGTAIGVTTNYTLINSTAGNYTVSQPAGLSADITPKPLTITGLSANNKVFDGNSTATLSGTAALSGFIAADISDIVLGGTGIANFTSTAIANNIPVTVTGYSISGSASGNYTLTQPAGLTASITDQLVYINTFDGSAACPTQGNIPVAASMATGTPLTRSVITCQSTGSVFNSTTLNNTASVSATSYIQFSATANAGYKLDIRSVSFFRQVSTTAPTLLEVAYSTDNFATSTTWGSAPVSPVTGTVATWDMTDFSTPTAGTVTFRIYPYGTQRTDGTASSAGGTFRLDDVSIYGNVTAVAQGSTAAVISNGTGNSSVCAGTTANIKVAITGGTSPYTVVINPGAITVNNYVSGTDIPVTPSINTTYTLVSVTDANSTAGTGNSGSAIITVTNPTVTATAGTGGTISPNGTTTLSCGGTQIYTITPLSCYSIADVLVDGVSVGAVGTYTFTNVTAPHTISASFTQTTYTITASAGTNGTISPSGATSVNCAGNQTYTITPASCYTIADVLVDGLSVGAVATYTFTNVTANHTISATFAQTTYTITASAGTNGTISPSGATSVNCAANQTYTITPASCYTIADVLVDGVSVGAVGTYTFTNVTANHTISATFAQTTYTITASAGTNGAISPSGATSVNCAANQTYTITPASCYTIADVLVDGVSVGALGTYTFTNVTANHTIAATFAATTYTITASAGTNGTISPSGATSVNCSANQTYTITPASCYTIADVLVDGVSVGAVGTYTFTNVTANHTISATFAQTTYTITASAGTNGSITPNGATSVNCAANQTYTITAASCYTIADVLVDGVSVGAVGTYTFTNVTANHTISATFTQTTYTITASAGTNGTISPSGATSVNCAANQTYTITPSSCYSIADVLVDGISVGAVGTYTFTNVTANHMISATFAQTTYTITASAGTNGTISPSGATSVNCAANQTYTITPASCYTIADVLVDGVSVGAVGTYTFTNVTANHTISATFTQTTYTITVSAGSNGTISPNGPATVSCGTNQTFTITPASCYTISNVLVDGVSVGAVGTYTFTNVTATHTISATFAQTTYTITASAGTNGTISPNGAASVNCGANQTFSITPDGGYIIADVLVDGVSAGAVGSYTFSNVSASHTISASFIAGTVTNYTITASSSATGGSISPNGTIAVAPNSNQTFNITAASGYTLTNVTVDGASVGAVTSYTFTNVTTNHSINAVFKATVSADPTLVSAEITDMSSGTIDPNLIPLGSSNKVFVTIQNLSIGATETIPSGTTKVRIDLGSKLKLDPAYNLATAPLSNFFAWSKVVEAGNDVIYGDQIADIPNDFLDQTSFNVNATTIGTSLVDVDFLITNQNNPSYFFVDQNPTNNSANVNYTVISNLSVSVVSQTNVACFGTSTGSATVSATGGATPYQYKIGTGAYQSSPVFTALAAGSYIITAMDFAGQLATTTVTISQPAAALTAVLTSQTNVGCFGSSTGSVVITPSGGTAGYTITPAQTGLAAGTYTFTVTDANGCTTTVNATITQPAAALTAVLTSQTNVGCFGNATGSVVITPSGGTAGYTITPAQTGLAAGTYTFTVTDANGCTTTVNATITQPAAALTAVLTSQTNVGCFGNSTGSVVITPSGGTSGYTITPAQTGLAAGTYTFTVTDANGCTTTVNATINQPAAALTAVLTSQTNVGCFGSSTGSVVIAPSGGTAGYTITPAQTGLAAGTYTFTVTDATGCTTTVNATITQPAAALTAVLTSQTNVGCFGNATGSVVITPSGGTSGYTITPAQTGLAAGTYTFTVTDANGCTTTVNATITQPAAALTAVLTSQTNVGCFGNSTGSVVITPSGGTSGYTITPAQTGLAAGTYTFTVTDANGCTTTVNATITQPAAALTAVLTSQTNVSCFGSSTGSVVITPSGGTSGYTITPAQTGLAAGTYTFTVTDANGCTTTVNATITQPAAALTAVLTSQTNVGCFGNSTGSVVITPSGGTSGYTITPAQTGLAAGTYTFTVTDANGCTTTVNATITQPAAALTAVLTSQTNVGCFGNSTGSVVITPSGGTSGYTITPAQTGLAAGTYTFTVTDANGCTTTVNATITQPAAALVAAETHTNVTCFGTSTGTATITATAGTSPYTGTGTFTGLAAGTYNYTVSDANGCTSVVTVTVTQPASALVAAETHTNVTCFGTSTGTATITATGGTAPYSGTGTFTGLAAGTYNYTVSDANGCTSVVTVTITQPSAALVAAEAHTNVTCFGTSTGTATITATGGTSPYSGTGTFTGLAAGTYNYTVSDANGCTSVVTVTITQPSAALVAAEAHTNVTCFGTSTGTATITVTGGTAPYTGTGTFTGLAAGTYNYTVSDANGCTSVVTVTITQPASALVAAETHTNVTCFGTSTGTATITATGGTAPYTGTGTFTGLAAGTYNYTVSDANGCTSVVIVTITQPASAIDATVTSQVNIGCGATTGSVTVTATGGTPAATAPFYRYKLDAGAYQNSGSFSGLSAGLHIVTAMDANGCTKTVSFTITQQTAPTDISLGSVFDNNLFPNNGDEVNVVYNISELAGTAANPSVLRIFKPSGYNVTFDNLATTVAIGSTNYTVENPMWTLTSTTGLYYEFSRTGTANTINCNSFLRIAFKVKRNTVSKSKFNVNAQFRLATGEVISGNNTNSIIMIGE